jgi:hypothetical protein
MPRLQCDDRRGAFSGTAAAAYAFFSINPGIKAFIYLDCPHRANFPAAAAGDTVALIYYSVSFWQVKHLSFTIYYDYAILSGNFQGGGKCDIIT